MNENMPTNVQLEANANGTVSFATDVVATIAGLAATEIEGVAGMAGTNNSASLADILTRRMSGMAGNSKNLTKGVKVEVVDGKVNVDVNFIVEYGTPVPEVAKNIQENVKKAIETMSGLNVENIDVHVQGISFERENRAVAEIEQQQRLLLQKEQEAEEAAADESAPQEEAEIVAEEPAEEAPSAGEEEEQEEQE